MLPMCSTMSLRTVGVDIARSALGGWGSRDIKWGEEEGGEEEEGDEDNVQG